MRHRGGPPPSVAFAAGVAAAGSARALLTRKFRRELRALNAGDHRPLLSNYADEAVLRFNEGEHR